MKTFIEEMIVEFSYIAVMLLILVENLFPPIPSEIILTLGGFITAKFEMSLIAMIIAATVGSVIGAIILYYIGTIVREQVLRDFLKRYYKFFRVKEKELDLVFSMLKKHGKKLIFFGRMIPVVRSLISIPAGMIQMDKKVFVIYTTLGTLTWNTVLLCLGYVLGERWEVVLEVLESYSTLIKVIAVVVVIGLMVTYLKRIFTKERV